MKSRSGFFKRAAKAAAFGGGAYVLAKGVEQENEKWRKMDEEYKAMGLPSARPFSQQTGDQQQETLRYWEKNGCRKAEARYTGTGHPFVECVGGWEKPKKQDARVAPPRPGKSG